MIKPSLAGYVALLTVIGPAGLVLCPIHLEIEANRFATGQSLVILSSANYYWLGIVALHTSL